MKKSLLIYCAAVLIGMLEFFSGYAQTANPQSCYAVAVKELHQGKRKNGTDVIPLRSDPSKALGKPQEDDNSNKPTNYFSLGFGGEVILDLGVYAINGEGNDLSVFETSYGNPLYVSYPERAEVYASFDGINFVYLNTTCQDGSFDFGSLPAARYIKIHDVSDPLMFGPLDDGFDLDGVKCLNGSTSQINPPPLVSGSAQHYSDYVQGKQKNGKSVSPNRSMPERALGFPQKNYAYNFLTLGIGGTITLQFDYTVFNKEGADLQVIETSFGNPSCNTYPETVHAEGSLDKINWFELGEVCMDGLIDLGSNYALNYIRLTDVTQASNYPGSGDGFDIAGVICYDFYSSRLIYDDVATPDADDAEIAVYPNPTNSAVNIDFRAEGKTTVFISDYLGQKISYEEMNFESSTLMSRQIDMSSYSNGIYFVMVENFYGKQTVKFVKE